MDSGAVVVAVVGIVVSGVLGPVVLSSIGWRHDRRRSFQEADRERRTELRNVLDDAAVLLAAGPRMLRQIRDDSPDSAKHREATVWSDQVYPMRERLLLRLPADHPVITTYDAVRDALTSIVRASADGEDAISEFEAARDAFLSAARSALDPTTRGQLP
jgi:hypothetical protein